MGYRARARIPRERKGDQDQTERRKRAHRTMAQCPCRCHLLEVAGKGAFTQKGSSTCEQGILAWLGYL